MVQVVIPYFSGSGKTREVAHAVLAGVQKHTQAACLVDVAKITQDDWKKLKEAHGIIFGAPTYMGSVAGAYKLFLEQTTHKGLWTGQALVDKLAAGFTVSSSPSGDKLSTLIQLAVFAAQHGMIWVNNSGVGSKAARDPQKLNQWGAWMGVMATLDQQGAVETPDLLTAQTFGERFVKAVQRWEK